MATYGYPTGHTGVGLILFSHWIWEGRKASCLALQLSNCEEGALNDKVTGIQVGVDVG